jgi:tetratricopeptide (TPR) repeat protein
MGRQGPRHVDDAAALGERIREARQARRLSLRDVAFPGCSSSFLSRVEAGARVPSAATIAELAERLGVTAEHLVGRPLDNRVPDADLIAAEVSARLGEQGAEERLRALLDRSRQLGDMHAESRLLEALGLLALELRDDSRAVGLLEEALDVDPRPTPRDRPGLYRALGRAHAGSGDLVRGIAVLRTAFDEVAGEPADVALMAQLGTFLANAYTDNGDFGEAERVLAAIISHEVELAPGNAVRLEWTLARTYSEQGRFAIAESYTRRVLARLESSEHDTLIGRAHLLLGSVLVDQHRVDEALPHLDRAEELMTDGSSVELATISIDRARAAVAAGDFDRAEMFARKALDQSKATEPGNEGTAYGLLAKVELERGNLDEARFLCRQALDRMTGPLYLRAVYETLAEVEEHAGNLEAALAALRARPTVLRRG